MTDKTNKAQSAIFRALVSNDGKMVAGLAAIPGGAARFFILQRRETEEVFVGRVSAWIKDQGAPGLKMEQPDVIPDGTSAPEFLLRLRVAIAAEGTDPDASEFAVKNPTHTVADKGQAN